ncbi:MAG: Hsp70 family protein, partial [Burkholderiales bacterium]|nr:Hsp70 family protein [Burkholderiales bacterium]
LAYYQIDVWAKPRANKGLFTWDIQKATIHGYPLPVDLALRFQEMLLPRAEGYANGILHVGAKDKATGKENKITIKANSGLTEEEIQKMVKDAELNAEEDKKVKELAESRNQADALVHSTRKSLTEYGDKLEAGEKDKIEAAIKDLEDSLKSSDKAEIDAKVAALSTASQKLGEKMYADMQAQQAAAGGAGAAGADGAHAHAGDAKAKDEDVVDADFKEVKDNK